MLMGTYLDPAYVHFVESGGSLGNVVQEVIDRMQYSKGFLEDLYVLLNKYESPFETIMEMQDKVVPIQVRKLKSQYCAHSDTIRSTSWDGDY
jgi:hypothetical protein